MKIYTVMVSWMTPGKRGYTLRSKTLHGIIARNNVEASKQALETIAGKINPAVNCVWSDWPQKGLK